MPTGRTIITMLAAALPAATAGCAATAHAGGRGQDMTYVVKHAETPLVIDADWDKPAWKNVQALELTRFMGAKPAHMPRTQAKLLYDDRAVYVIFRVDDHYVRAAAKQHQDPVCLDSCVEFFFTPSEDTGTGYFNLEMNCGGTMLYHFQTVPRKDLRRITAGDLERIEVAHSMPRIVDPEIAEPTTWTVEYRLPTDTLDRCCPGARKPAPGVSWRANFYKCADETSHPHWLTWAPVDRPQPDFHVPDSFATLRFD